MPTRRGFLAGALALPLWPGGPLPRIAGTRADGSGRFHVTAFEPDGRALFDIALPARGHGLAVAPGRGELVVVARRPGRFLAVVDLAAGRIARQLPNAAGRRFCGHGVFDAEAGRFYATERVEADGTGLIGVYDPRAGYRRLGEIETGGDDPHELLFAGDGRTLIVANGGVGTRPVDSSIVHIDAPGGTRRGQWRLPPEFAGLSLRHLARAPDGRLAIAMQAAEKSPLVRPLIALQQDEQDLTVLPAADGLWQRLDGYGGSIAFAAAGDRLAITSPRGGCALVFETRGWRPQPPVPLDDGCGLAALGGGFLVAGGRGDLLRIGRDAARPVPPPLPGPSHWDNHLLAF